MNKDFYKQDLVSVIMPNYNGEKYICESIESVIAQTYADFELLIIDDGSLDKSVQIISEYEQKDKRVRLIKQENGGSAAARNRGIEEAKGQYIVLLDSDDVWNPNFLSEQLKFMKEKHALCVYSSYKLIDEDSKNIYSPVIAKPVITIKDMKIRNYIGCLTGVYDCSKYGKIFLDTNLRSLLDDYAYWYEIIKLSKIAYGNPLVLANYRIRSNSVSNNKIKLIKKHYKFYRQCLNLSFFHSILSTIQWGFAGVIKYS